MSSPAVTNADKQSQNSQPAANKEEPLTENDEMPSSETFCIIMEQLHELHTNLDEFDKKIRGLDKTLRELKARRKERESTSELQNVSSPLNPAEFSGIDLVDLVQSNDPQDDETAYRDDIIDQMIHSEEGKR